MHVETQPLEASPTAPGQSWFARLIAFIAWLFGAERKLKRIRPATRFKPDWRDRYPELLSVEWHRDQMLAQGAALLLSGKTLDSADYVHIPMPPGYGGPCPRTPFQIARRWLAITRFLKDPEAAIVRHAQRIAKRAGISLAVQGSTDARPCRAAHHEPVSVAPPKPDTARKSCLAFILGNARRARPLTLRSRRQAASPRAKDARVLPGARAPPKLPLLPIRYSLLPR